MTEDKPVPPEFILLEQGIVYLRINGRYRKFVLQEPVTPVEVKP